jgi:hypothetical protein
MATIDLEFSEIKCGADTARFAGRIVAYETNICYYGDQRSHWQKPGSPTRLYFGYVADQVSEWSHSDDQGPNMSTVLKPDAVPGNRAILRDMIGNHRGDTEKPFLKMREVAPDEIAAIKQAVASSQARIEYDNSGFFRALDSYLPKLKRASWAMLGVKKFPAPKG